MLLSNKRDPYVDHVLSVLNDGVMWLIFPIFPTYTKVFPLLM